MRLQTKPDAAQTRRPLDRQAMASISPLPPPEEVFIDWLMSVPPDDCLEAAARYQIEMIDRRMSPHPDVQCLRMLLLAVAGECEPVGLL